MLDADLEQIATKMIKSFHGFSKMFKPRLAQNELSTGESAIMMFICKNYDLEKQPLTPAKLSNIIGLSRSSITSILNKLENKGYITRVISKEDRRSLLIFLSEKGLNIAKENIEAMQERFYTLIRNLGEDDSIMLLKLLNKSADILEQINNQK